MSFRFLQEQIKKGYFFFREQRKEWQKAESLREEKACHSIKRNNCEENYQKKQ